MSEDKQKIDIDKSKTNFWRGVFGGIIGAIVILTIVLFVGHSLFNSPQQVLSEVNDQATVKDFEQALIDTVDKTSDAVVSVGNYQTQKIVTPFGRDGLSLEDIEDEPVMAGTGSGVIYKTEGDKAYIVTNNHVIDNAETIEVIMKDGQSVEAQLIGKDSLTDLAVLTIPKKYAKTTIDFADSDKIKVGSLAIAIGSPLGSEFSSSVTQGVVSGLNRTIPVDTDGDGESDWEMSLLQTDAAINPGNSGGALVNTQGQLIGINSSKLAMSAVEGMGFAIPSNDVEMITKQLEENGKVIRPVLGVVAYDLSLLNTQARVDTLKLDPEMTKGALVARLVSGSEAEKAGIKKYDVITNEDDKEIEDPNDLRHVLLSHNVVDKIKLTFIREGKEQSVNVSLNTAMDEVSDHTPVIEEENQPDQRGRLFELIP